MHFGRSFLLELKTSIKLNFLYKVYSFRQWVQLQLLLRGIKALIEVLRIEMPYFRSWVELSFKHNLQLVDIVKDT